MARSLPPLRLGSRGSALARWQAEHVQQRLAALGIACDIVSVTTTGDRRTDVPLADIGGKGLFTLEIETGLRDGTLDLAVHSLKDVPSALPPEFTLAAVLERADPRDALLAAAGVTLASLPRAARVGTSSLRRQAQLLALRPDLVVTPLRGNVDTRLRRLRGAEYDAILLAAAGLQRLGLEAAVSEYLPPEQFIPAAGQGVLAIECRAGDKNILAACAPLHHPPTACAIAAERALLRRLDCGCQAPVGAFATLTGAGLGRPKAALSPLTGGPSLAGRPGAGPSARLLLTALVAAPDGTQAIRRQATAPASDTAAAEALGDRLGQDLLAAGAAELLREIYAG